MSLNLASLLSTHKSPSSDLHINLHPLVLLTISDYITRHTLRRQDTPIVGALIGQQSGRSVSLEHAFECQTVQNNGQILLHEAWFKDRLQQYKDVHLAPALELVGWFTTTPVTGPEAAHVPIHQQILHTYNETAVLLAFHPSSVLEGAAVGGKLPLTIYESVYENNEGQGMEIDGADAPLDLKFRELPYSVETGEAEMISVDFVARGGGNATAIDSAAKDTKGQASQKAVGQVDRKGKAVERESKAVDDSSILSPEDEEVIASLTARANAVKMLHARIQLLKAYLTSLPPSYLTTTLSTTTNTTTTTTTNTTTTTKNNNNNNNHLPSEDPATPPTEPESPILELNHPLLRSILALLSRLPLLLPPEHHSTFRQETLAEKSDVQLVSLLGSLGRSVKEAREMGRKFAFVEGANRGKGKGGYMSVGVGGGAGGGGAMDDGWGGGGGGGPGLNGDGGSDGVGGGLGGVFNREGGTMDVEGGFAG